MKKLLILTVLFSFTLLTAQSKNEKELETNKHNKMEWFKDAKLGIFIHWGIYAVKGISESWSFYNGHISHKNYLKQTEGFKAEKYNPELWAKLIKESGAKYSVITSRHHDGFALWNTKYGKLNSLNNSAAKRDVLTPFVKALRKNNLKVGVYYSLSDWSNQNYTHFTRKENRYKIKDQPKKWEKYLYYLNGQLAELANKYNPDLWWFDGDWEHSGEEWRASEIRKMLLTKNPNAILNSRLRGKGDYDTPEQGLPVLRPEAKYWELCYTMNDSWGFQKRDSNYKSPQELLDVFVDCISQGGNLLLDIGPKADGTIPDEQINILKIFGKWISKNSEAIYKTKRGIPYDHFYGPTTLSKDRKTLFLFVKGNPNNQILLKGIVNDITEIYDVATKAELHYKRINKVPWNDYPGMIFIDIPGSLIDKYYTVIALKFAEPLKLYKKVVGAIESN